MCGIAGIAPAIDMASFKNILVSLAHRGPDGAGMWRHPDDNILLGHRRLSVLDLSDSGNQPMHFEYLTISFNGEIYNYVEVRKTLEQRGYRFTTETDTEVILKAFHYWGDECQHKFNGMWAFAIYDSRSRKLFLSRDRFGEKPLYYYHDGATFCFASEVQAIHKMLGPKHPLDDSVLKELAEGSNGWHGREQTYIKGVNVLKAGHSLQWSDGNLQNEKKWYDLRETTVPAKFEDQVETFRMLLKDSCAIRLRSDVPVGTCLSGGLDSGSITALLNSGSLGSSRQYTHKSFCASFPNTPIDESSKARRLAKQLNTDLSVIEIEAPDPDELESAMAACDGPMHALAFYPIWKLYQFIRNSGIVVTLDGQGPDEMMGGYRPIGPAIQYSFRKRKLRYLRDVYQVYSSQGETTQISSRAIANHALKGTLRSEITRVGKKMLGVYREESYQHPFRRNPFDEELFSEFFVSPLPGILQQYDRCSMAHGVECRMPFLDYRLVEFVFSLPPESKVGNGFTKYILRAAMHGIVPDETRLDKVKIGFNAPIVDWYRGPLRVWMLDIMSSQEYLSTSLFDGKTRRREFEQFLNGANLNWADAWRFWGGVHYAWWRSNLNRQAWN